MDLMKGGDLFKHLKRKKKFKETEVKFIVACIAMALGHLHSKNFVYRDLKPENVLFAENGYIRLTDFGLSKYLKQDQ
jgi:serum/glucocorticoid-regulated kinase 2